MALRSCFWAPLKTVFFAATSSRFRAREASRQAFMHSWRSFAIFSVHQYAGRRRRLTLFRGMKASQALVISTILHSTKISPPSQEVVPAGSDSDSAASCNVATGQSLFNLFTLQSTDHAAGLTSSEFVSSKRIYWWSLLVSFSDTRQPLISPAQCTEAKFTSGIEFPKSGRLHVNADP